MTEPWWASTTVYQVYPRSFADANGDGIGDLPGIVDRLDHLVDLGVGTLWVSPFFSSPQVDFGYDISDYCDVAPEYGTLDDAQRLIDEAHARGLRVVFDLVPNHTSDQHPWFLESRSSRDNPKADWYLWRDGRGADGHKKPNNWRSVAEITSGWQWCEERQQWFLATFLPCQPDLNWRNPEVRDAMFDAVRFWLARGVDGFRLDMFGDVMKDPDFADLRVRPSTRTGFPRIFDRSTVQNTDDNVQLAIDLRAVCREYDDVGGPVGAGPDAANRERLLIGEVFGAPGELARFRADGDGLQLVFLFSFLTVRYDAAWIRDRVVEFERAFPAPAQPTYVLENHDRTRLLDRVGGHVGKAKVLATILLLLRGVPTIYQGQELAQSNTYIPLRDAHDPIVRTHLPWLPEVVNRRLPERLNRDEVRTPMQWDASPTAGFCPPGVTPWLPVNDDRATANVADQTGDPDSVLSLYRDLLRVRREHRALHAGRLDLVPGAPAGTIAWVRSDGGERVLVAANLTDAAVTVPLGGPAGGVLVATDPSIGVDEPGAATGASIRLPAHSAAAVQLAAAGSPTVATRPTSTGGAADQPPGDVRIGRLDADAPIDEVAAAMVEGFLDDPLYVWLHPVEVRPRHLFETFRFMLDAGRANGRVEVARTATDHVVGVAVWTAAGEELLDAPRAQTAESLFRSQLGDRADTAFEGMAACAALEPHGPHAVLHSIVVRTEARDAGLGGRLIAPLLEHCDREQVVASLDSSDERNLTFYRRHGFIEMGEVALPDGPVMRALHRPPRTG